MKKFYQHTNKDIVKRKNKWVQQICTPTDHMLYIVKQKAQFSQEIASKKYNLQGQKNSSTGVKRWTHIQQLLRSLHTYNLINILLA